MSRGRGRDGFTLIELLMVMIVLGVLAGLASLKYIDLRHRARAAQVAADLEAVRLAAYGVCGFRGHNRRSNTQTESMPSFSASLATYKMFSFVAYSPTCGKNIPTFITKLSISVFLLKRCNCRFHARNITSWKIISKMFVGEA